MSKKSSNLTSLPDILQLYVLRQTTSDWQVKLAKDLGVSKSLVCRWVSKERNITEEFETKILNLL